MSYRVLLEEAAQRDFRKLDPQVARRVHQRLLELEQNPRPPGDEQASRRSSGSLSRPGRRLAYPLQGG